MKSESNSLKLQEVLSPPLYKTNVIWKLPMQHTHDMLYFVKQLFTAVCSAKHAHNLLGVGDKVKESSKWKHVALIEIDDVPSKKLGLQIFQTLKINDFILQL